MVDMLTKQLPYNSILRDVLYKKQRIVLICQDFPAPFEYIMNSIGTGNLY